MSNLIFENKLLLNKDINKIKNIWFNVFKDENKIIDYFFETVFQNEKGVGAFLNNELIAIILFLEANLTYNESHEKALYFYAVCTDEKYRNKGVMKSLFEYAKMVAKERRFDICFLVPENDGFFKMYEKLDFKTNIFYTEKLFHREDVDIKNTISSTTDFCYNDYLKSKTELSKTVPTLIWNEPEFEFVFNKNRTDVKFIFSNCGYAIYEISESEIVVSEICGEIDSLLSMIFQNEKDVKTIKCKLSTCSNEIKFGMTYSFNNQYKKSIYFGMPYG